MFVLYQLLAMATCGLRGHRKRFVCAQLRNGRMCGDTVCLCSTCPRH